MHHDDAIRAALARGGLQLDQLEDAVRAGVREFEPKTFNETLHVLIRQGVVELRDARLYLVVSA